MQRWSPTGIRSKNNMSLINVSKWPAIIHTVANLIELKRPGFLINLWKHFANNSNLDKLFADLIATVKLDVETAELLPHHAVKFAWDSVP